MFWGTFHLSSFYPYIKIILYFKIYNYQQKMDEDEIDEKIERIYDIMGDNVSIFPITYRGWIQDSLNFNIDFCIQPSQDKKILKIFDKIFFFCYISKIKYDYLNKLTSLDKPTQRYHKKIIIKTFYGEHNDDNKVLKFNKLINFFNRCCL